LRSSPLRAAWLGTVAICVMAALPASAADDPGLVRLRQFLDGTTTLKARFKQTIVEAGERVVEASAGTVAMERPGRFRWDYEEPFARVIVADGSRVWLYEADLAQVTVRPLTAGIGDTPAALLTGKQDVLQRFSVVRSWRADGLLWVALKPKAADSDFAEVRIGFDRNVLARLDLDDRLGQQTRVAFSGVVLNPRLPPATFVFEVPPGADVIDEDDL
jgi:outer membrane lipoprotein carrier protein